jgi:hypothetical protein
MTFEDELDAAQAADPIHIDVPVELNGKLHVLRFYQWAGIEWATEADRHPARPGVLVDKRYGYNLRTLCLAAAKVTGRRLNNGEPVELSPERWEQLFKTLGGAPVGRICDAIWGLNEAAPAEAVEQAKKEYAASSAATSS